MSSTPDLILTQPTTEERIQWAKGTHPQWGGKLSLEKYIERELNTSGPLNRDGGLTGWLLTDASAPAGDRPLLSSCDTLRKRALVRGKDGQVREGFAHGVASVFTLNENRGKGYAGKMMNLLGKTLAEKEKTKPGDAMFSVLFSDIGKEFYAARGWKALDSTHFTFPVDASAEYEQPEGVDGISVDDLTELTRLDEQRLRRTLEDPSAENGKIKVAIIPDLDHMLWNVARQSLRLEASLPSAPKPTVQGAIVTTPSSRLWVIWVSSVRDGGDLSKNALPIIRFVIEKPDAVTDEDLSAGLEKLIAAARREAKAFKCSRVQLWSPTARIKKVVEANPRIGGEFVVRDSSILSLNWLGEGSADDVEWIDPEQYTWC